MVAIIMKQMTIDKRNHLPSYPTPAAFGAGTASTFVILCCWNIWKHCNGVVFQGDTPCLPLLLSRCREDASLVPPALSAETVSWGSCL
jgi:hypothetical protein